MPDFLSTAIDDEIDDPKLLSSWGVPRSYPPMRIMARNWSLTDEINVWNSELIKAINKVISGNKILIKNHLILLLDSFGLNLIKLNLRS